MCDQVKASIQIIEKIVLKVLGLSHDGGCAGSLLLTDSARSAKITKMLSRMQQGVDEK